MKNEVHVNLGESGRTALEVRAKEMGVVPADLIRQALRVMGVEVPAVQSRGLRAKGVKASHMTYCYLGPEGYEALEVKTAESGIPKARLVRMGLERLGVKLANVRRAGNPNWVRRSE